MAQSLDQFIISLVFDNKLTAESAQKIDSTITGLKNKIITAFSAIASFDFLKNAVKSSIELATKLDNLSYATNISKENLTAWGEAVKRNGGTAEGFYNSVSSLSDKIREMQTSFGSSGASAFFRFGINLRDSNGQAKSAIDVISELSNKFKNLSRPWQISLGQQLGLDTSTIRLLSQGNEEVQKLVQKMAKYANMSTLNTEKNIRLRNSLYDVSLVFQAIKLRIANDLIPVVQKFSELFLKGLAFLDEHARAVRVVLLILSTVMSGILLSAIVGVTRAIIVMGIALLKNPFVWITAAIVGFVLILDDFFSYLEGKKSALEKFYKILGATWVAKGIRNIADAIKYLGNAIADVSDKSDNFIRNLFGINQTEDPLMKKIEDFRKSKYISEKIKDAAISIGLDPNVAIDVARKESGLNPNAKNTTSSASGIFQLTDATALSNGITDLSKKNDIDTNIKAGVLNLKKVTDGLSSYFGRTPTPAEVSIGEMFGLSGGERIFSSNRNTMLSSIFNPNVLNANPQYKNMTTGQLINNANKTFQQKSVTVGDVKINAPNSNAKDISRNIKREIQQQLSMMVTNFDNGVLA